MRETGARFAVAAGEATAFIRLSDLSALLLPLPLPLPPTPTPTSTLTPIPLP